MTDNPTNLPADKLVSQADPVAADTTPSPMATPPVTPAVVDSTPNTTARIATSNVTPPIQEVPQRDIVVDPRVIALRAMFPDYDDELLCVRSTRVLLLIRC